MTLLEAIVNLDLLPGARVVESRLAADLGVSRIPIREALRQLEAAQLVVMHHRRGTYVAPLTARDATEVYTVRITLESLAARLAAENASGAQIRAMEATLGVAADAIASGRFDELRKLNAQFHRQIIDTSDNRMLVVALESVGHHVARLRTIQNLSADEATHENAQQGHLAILQAISRRQARRAEQLMEEHVRLAITRIVPLLEAALREDASLGRLIARKRATHVAPVIQTYSPVAMGNAATNGDTDVLETPNAPQSRL